MAWRDRLRPASFRGVPFFIEASQYTGGRRVQFHEFPDRDLPYPEDIGKVGNTYRVDGHIIGGDEYWTLKNRLVEACNKEGPGELIHPYYGTLQVQCGPLSIEENTLEGRFAKVTFLFYEAGDDSFPTNVDDKEALVDAAAENALAQAKTNFDNNFSIKDQPGFVVEGARAQVQAAADAFTDATKGVVTDAERIADLAFSIRNLKAEANTLLQSPAKLSQRFLDSLNLLEGAVGVPDRTLQAHSTLFRFGSAALGPSGVTPERATERANFGLINNFIIQSAVVKATQQAIQVDYESVEAAEASRDQLIEVMDAQILTTTDDNVFNSFKDLLARMVDVLPSADGDLPSLKTVQIPDTIPSLVLAYDLFENPETEEDIINRNGIRHPGFIEGLSELEVIDVRSSS